MMRVKLVPILKKKKPKKVSWFRFVEFDIGPAAPRFTNFVIHRTHSAPPLGDPLDPSMDAPTFQVDLDVDYASESNIKLRAKVGPVTGNCLIRDISFSGRIRCLITLGRPPKVPQFCSSWLRGWGALRSVG